jgi:chromosome segregation ATPase
MSSDDLTKNLSKSDDKLDELLGLVRGLEVRMSNFETRLDNFETRLGNVETGVGNLGVRLESLESVVEKRLHDTRPMWETVRSELAELRNDIEIGFAKADTKMDSLVRESFETRVEMRQLERRVERLEKRP